jgi:hypothetical protein
VNSSITCSPCNKEITPHYEWEVTGPQGFVDQGNGLPAEFIPPYEGTYKVILNATCDDEKCEPCKITLGKVVFCEQDESPKATGTENGSCLGTVLLVAIIALGTIALQKRKD